MIDSDAVHANAERVEPCSPALRASARYAGNVIPGDVTTPSGLRQNVSSFPRLARGRAQAWAEGLNAFGVLSESLISTLVSTASRSLSIQFEEKGSSLRRASDGTLTQS